MALVGRDPDFIFIHIFKTGGMSIREALKPYKDRTFDIHGGHSCLEDTQAHMVAREGLDELYQRAFKFAIVRNPFDWLVSHFAYMKRARKHDYYKRVQPMSFENWLYFYTGELMTLERPYGANKFLTQRGFCVDRTGNIGLDYIGRIEDMRSAINEISRRLMLPLELHRTNCSANRSADYMRYYTFAMRQHVHSVFAEDFEAFGY